MLPSFLFPHVSDSNLVEGDSRAAGEPSVFRRRYGVIELRKRGAIRHGSAHPLGCNGRSAASSPETPCLCWRRFSTLASLPQNPCGLPSQTTSQPFSVRAGASATLIVLCANIQSSKSSHPRSFLPPSNPTLSCRVARGNHC